MARFSSSSTRNGQAIAYSYNSLGEVTREDFGNGVHTDFTYDARGNLLTAADASGTTTFGYNDSAYPDQVTSVTYPSGLFINYGYDSEGRLNRVNQNGYVVNYAYDSSGRLSTVTDASGATIVGYQYNDANQVTRKDMGNGTYTDLHLHPERSDCDPDQPRARRNGQFTVHLHLRCPRPCRDHDDPSGDDDIRLRRGRPAHLGDAARRSGHHLWLRRDGKSHHGDPERRDHRLHHE